MFAICSQLGIISLPLLNDITDSNMLQATSSFGQSGLDSMQGARRRVINLQIMQGKDLPAADYGKSSDPYVEIIPLEGQSDDQLRTMTNAPFPRTNYVPNQLNPVWSGRESRFVLCDRKAFNVNQKGASGKLDKNFVYIDFDKVKYLLIKVFDHDTFGHDDLLGGFQIKMDQFVGETAMEKQHDEWYNLQQQQEMLKKTHKC